MVPPRTVIFPESVTIVVTLNVKPMLAFPPTVTTTGPVVAVVGTGTEILVSLQLVGVALTPLKVIVLLPCVAPKVVPVIVSGSPATPDPGSRYSRYWLSTRTVFSWR